MTTNTCTTCGGELLESAGQTFCPACLLQQGMKSSTYGAGPDLPGLGYEVNRDVVNKLRIQTPADRPEPERLIETTWADGRRMYTASNGKVNFMLTAANNDKYPYYEKGADTKLVPDDGTARWRELYTRARNEGPISA